MQEGVLEEVVAEMRKLMPNVNPTDMLLRSPDSMLSFQPLSSQSRGDRDLDALGLDTG